MRSSVLFWYLRISLQQTVGGSVLHVYTHCKTGAVGITPDRKALTPGLLLVAFTPSVLGAVLRTRLETASSLWGVWKCVLFLAVCLVRAITCTDR